MNSYFNAGYHDWQSSELHHYAANRFCGSPSLPTTASTNSSQGSLYAGANNGYHSYMQHHAAAAAAAAAAASPNISSYASNMGYGALPPSPPSSHSRYGDTSGVGTSRAAIFGSHHPHNPHHHHAHSAATSAALSAHSFSNGSNLQSHLYGDHIVFGNLSTHYPVSASELAYSEIAASSQQQQQSGSCSEHLVGNESSVLRDGTSPESHLPNVGEKALSDGECSVGENGTPGNLLYPSVCQLGKLSSGSVPPYLDTSPILGPGSTGGLKDGASQHTFEDSSPSSTPDLSSGPSSALHQQQSGKAFFPWMKSYTGKFVCLLFIVVLFVQAYLLSVHFINGTVQFVFFMPTDAFHGHRSSHRSALINKRN